MKTLLSVIGKGFAFLSVVTLVTTIAALPWMLGGVIPLARLTLLTGAVAASVFSLLAALLTYQPPRALPAILLPLAGLAMLGVFQLRSVSEYPVLAMEHAQASEMPTFTVSPSSMKASLNPAGTRTTIALLLALCLVASTAFDRLRTRRLLTMATVAFVANGVAIAAVGLTQFFHKEGFVLNQQWSLGWNEKSSAAAFGTFVNPNNAAGWLCLCFACATGWMMYHLQLSGAAAKQNFGKLNVPLWEKLWQRIISFVADLTVWQIMAIVSVVFLGTSIAATQSRGGILALIVGVVFLVASKSSLRRLPIALFLTAVCAGGAYGMLQWLELDEDIVGEMETLKDLDTAAGVRPRHWLDSLHVLADFPLTGTGLSSYQFATLPYQSQHNGIWFRYADNSYVDTLVDGGLTGITLFLLLGLLGFLLGFAGWNRQKAKSKSRSRSSSTPRVSRRLLGAIGTVTLLATASQAVAAFFDYGPTMPAAASLLILMLAAGCGFLDGTDPSASIRRSVSMPCSALVAVPCQICLLIAAISFVPDQLAAVEIDKSVVQGHQLLMGKVSVNDLDDLDDVRAELQKSLVRRNDDAEGLRVLARLCNASFRWKVLQATDPIIRTKKSFSRIWERYTLVYIVDVLGQLRRQDPAAAAGLTSQMAEVASESGLRDALGIVQSRCPLMPKIAEAQSALGVLIGTPNIKVQAGYARFSQPTNPATYYQLGVSAIASDLPDVARGFWQSSLSFSDKFRVSILRMACSYMDTETALNLFGPLTYAECVDVAMDHRSAGFREEVWDRAAHYWKEVTPPADEATSIARAAHLMTEDRLDEAIEWLEECLRFPGENLEVSRALAEIFEKQGRYRESMVHWKRIQYLRPRDDHANEAIDRINNR